MPESKLGGFERLFRSATLTEESLTEQLILTRLLTRESDLLEMTPITEAIQ